MATLRWEVPGGDVAETRERKRSTRARVAAVDAVDEELSA
jgi:hypothetical protein